MPKELKELQELQFKSLDKFRSQYPSFTPSELQAFVFG